MNLNKKGMDALLNLACKGCGATPDSLKKDLEKGDYSNLMNNMDSSQSQKLKEVLSNPALTKKIMSSPQAQELNKKLSK